MLSHPAKIMQIAIAVIILHIVKIHSNFYGAYRWLCLFSKGAFNATRRSAIRSSFHHRAVVPP